MQSRLSQLVIKRQGGRAAFTIMELVVAMTLMMMLVTISGVVFRSAVRTYRTASATAEILRKYQAITSQLSQDLAGLRQEDEFILVWAPGEVYNSDGSLLDEDDNNISDRYDSFDRLYFFADGNFRTYGAQPLAAGGSRVVETQLARICYSFGREIVDPDNPAADIEVYAQRDYRRRMLCRTQHLVATDGNLAAILPQYPGNVPAGWIAGWTPDPDENTVPAGFWARNNKYEYQPMDIGPWTALNTDGNWWNAVKREMLAAILNLRVDGSTLIEGGPRIDLENQHYLHHVLAQGVGQFHVQIWREDLQRWYPELDPNHDGNYADADAGALNDDTGYVRDGNGGISVTDFHGPMANFFPGDDTVSDVIGSALKFTFTLYDSKQIFPEGKTFTHIVYLN